VLRIAHAHGNRAARVEAAIAAGVDVIETDLRWRGDRVWVRHEHRLGCLPLLFNNRVRGIHREGPLALNVGPWHFRLDRPQTSLQALLDLVGNRAGLALDFKDAVYTRDGAEEFVAAVLATIDRSGFDRRLELTGAWPLLDIVRGARPNLLAHYSVDDERDFDVIRPRLLREGGAIGVSIRVDLYSDERAAILRRSGADVWAWNVEGDDEARRALERGAAGIMADDLELLARLGAVPERTS